MHLLKKSNEKSTLKLFFEVFLTRVFGIESTYQPESDEMEIDDNNYDNNKKLNKMYSEKWFYALKKEYDILKATSSDINLLFKEYFITTCNHIDEERDYATKFCSRTSIKW